MIRLRVEPRSVVLAALALIALALTPLERPIEEPTLDDRITLARALVAEADFHEPDHQAIAWVLAKRYRITRGDEPFAAFVARYCSAFKTDTYRSRTIRQLPWGTAPLGHPWKTGWTSVRRFVESWLRGNVQDPCPEAMHFGGPMDTPPPGWRLVQCGETRNRFYATGDDS
jgi:hypothetical protein